MWQVLIVFSLLLRCFGRYMEKYSLSFFQNGLFFIIHLRNNVRDVHVSHPGETFWHEMQVVARFTESLVPHISTQIGHILAEIFPFFHPLRDPPGCEVVPQNIRGTVFQSVRIGVPCHLPAFTEEQKNYFKRINSMKLNHNRLIGFGISNPSTLKEAWDNSSGAIVGSFFIKCLESSPSIKESVDTFVNALEYGNLE